MALVCRAENVGIGILCSASFEWELRNNEALFPSFQSFPIFFNSKSSFNVSHLCTEFFLAFFGETWPQGAKNWPGKEFAARVFFRRTSNVVRVVEIWVTIPQGGRLWWCPLSLRGAFHFPHSVCGFRWSISWHAVLGRILTILPQNGWFLGFCQTLKILAHILRLQSNLLVVCVCTSVHMVVVTNNWKSWNPIKIRVVFGCFCLDTAFPLDKSVSVDRRGFAAHGSVIPIGSHCSADSSSRFVPKRDADVRNLPRLEFLSPFVLFRCVRLAKPKMSRLSVCSHVSLLTQIANETIVFPVSNWLEDWRTWFLPCGICFCVSLLSLQSQHFEESSPKRSEC